MKLRTTIEPQRATFGITHADKIVMLGSCFTDNVSALLLRDGFKVKANPMGVLYNPVTIATHVRRAIKGQLYGIGDLVQTADGMWHCLDYNTRYISADAAALVSKLNNDLSEVKTALDEASVVIITLGTAHVFSYLATDCTVGNCHKIAAKEFARTRLTVEAAAQSIQEITTFLPNKHVLFTVSPIRHLGDGLHGNNLSKATLHLAIDAVNAEYFPAYEIVCDDLRDYRFYGDDLRHPSAMAVEYIYEVFSQTYFNKQTQIQALQHRAAYLHSQHRQINIL